MRFAYYDNLSPSLQKTYRQSDAIESFDLGENLDFTPQIHGLKEALENDSKKGIRDNCSHICDIVCRKLDIEGVKFILKSKRPSNSKEELMGLYESEEGKVAQITVWVKTAQKKQHVAFKTFLRTMIHELCHHLDYYHLDLDDSLHTAGFFKRESKLYKKILGNIPITTRKIQPPKKMEAVQMELFNA